MDTPYVSLDAAWRAKEFEDRFLKLPPGAGVLFVSVEAMPIVGGDSKIYEIKLGLSRWHDGSAGKHIIQQVMQKELAERQYEIRGTTFRGQRVG